MLVCFGAAITIIVGVRAPCRSLAGVAAALLAAACELATVAPPAAEPGVVFTYPVDHQLDVPTGSRIVVTFSEPVIAAALGACGDDGGGGFCLVGPDGAVDAAAEVAENGKSVQIRSAALAEGTTYALHVGGALAPFARNLPASGPLLSFTTRATRPRAAPPEVIAINATAPARLGEPDVRPLHETTTLRLVFSEPLDPRTVELGLGAIELVDAATHTPVPATVYASGIHVSIDPIDDLAPGPYELRLGDHLTDLGGTPVAPIAFALEVGDSRRGAAPVAQLLRTRQPGDPGPADTRAGVQPNAIQLDNPLIGRHQLDLRPSTLVTELGDPRALGGPIAFTLRRGQRLGITGLDVALGGEIPAGLSTGDLQIELLTDADGRLYRNPYQPPSQRPDNTHAPLYVDLMLDVAVFATDPTGNAVLAQIALGVQATGTAIATDGVLAIETAAAMELGLLGVTSVPTNFVLELINDPTASAPVDTTPPELIATSPAAETRELAVDGGIELVFGEPVDLDRLRAGGLRLETAGGTQVAAAIEPHGAAVVVRPRARLAYGTEYRVVLADVADVAGNALAEHAPIALATPARASTNVPLTAVAVTPGAPCALTGAGPTSPGRCAGGAAGDQPYRPFELEAGRAIEVAFSAPLQPTSVTRGAACGAGSVRIEELDEAGACVGPVAGTLLPRARGLTFVPDRPWGVGARYRLTLVSGGNNACNANELCSLDGPAASFDPLNGTESGDGGGPNLVVDFVGAAPTGAVPLLTEAAPYTDVNGSGFVDGVESPRDENRAALRITGTTGSVSNASFTMADCLPATPETEGCMYLLGAMPVALRPLERDCALPGGGVAASCLPIEISAQAMYATSLAMSASVGISINANTGTNVLRVREPADGPLLGYLVDGGGGAPTMVVALELYLDAPDMSLPLSSHDLHSKPLALALEGPVSFLPDGRMAIELSNLADVPVSVRIDAPLGIGGTIDMVLPRGEMRLRLVSPALRGGPR